MSFIYTIHFGRWEHTYILSVLHWKHIQNPSHYTSWHNPIHAVTAFNPSSLTQSIVSLCINTAAREWQHTFCSGSQMASHQHKVKSSLWVKEGRRFSELISYCPLAHTPYCWPFFKASQGFNALVLERKITLIMLLEKEVYWHGLLAQTSGNFRIF